jgi:hypothetical protein
MANGAKQPRLVSSENFSCRKIEAQQRIAIEGIIGRRCNWPKMALGSIRGVEVGKLSRPGTFVELLTETIATKHTVISKPYQQPHRQDLDH